MRFATLVLIAIGACHGKPAPMADGKCTVNGYGPAQMTCEWQGSYWNCQDLGNRWTCGRSVTLPPEAHQ